MQSPTVQQLFQLAEAAASLALPQLSPWLAVVQGVLSIAQLEGRDTLTPAEIEQLTVARHAEVAEFIRLMQPDAAVMP